ncbi:MAG: nucleotidyl transferase AbiEii/AbiGii toxin family protein [Treponema sp.]|nr:nucleotidyl transferase AbiEii/AbiGii toxin family protein [Treponema sp.]
MYQTKAISDELLTILRQLQNNAVFENFILGGGTALALQMEHRVSDDIDLFLLTDSLDINKITQYLQIHHGNSYEIFHTEENILQATINSIKTDFIAVQSNLIENPVKADGITFFGLKDIAAMKLRVINNKKNRAKDFIDLCYLIQHFALEEMFEFYRIKYSCDDISNIKKILLESVLVNPYEWEKIKMLKHDIYLSDIPRILKNEVLNYNKKKQIKPDNISIFRKLFSFWHKD